MAKRTKAQRKAKRKERREKVKKALKKVAQAPAKAAEFAATIPFRPAMIAILKKRGITPKKKQSELTKQFFQLVIQNKSFEEENFVDAIADVVKAVVNFFRNRKETIRQKEAAGEQISEGEKNTAELVEEVERQAADVIRTGVEENVGQKVVKFITSPIGIGVIGVGLYFAFKPKAA